MNESASNTTSDEVKAALPPILEEAVSYAAVAYQIFNPTTHRFAPGINRIVSHRRWASSPYRAKVFKDLVAVKGFVRRLVDWGNSDWTNWQLVLIKGIDKEGKLELETKPLHGLSIPARKAV